MRQQPTGADAAPRLALAGLDGRDVASAAHPYLHLAALNELAAKSAARRARTARLTPGGLQQPPEVMGVDADARVPNPLQPMSGEFEDGREVGAGRPAFFGPGMPAPTGIADGVGVGRHPFGAPTGMVGRAPEVGADRFQWQPPRAPNDLAALPHFAAGGVVAPGQAGIVGEQGQELVNALPGGGAQVTPLKPSAASAGAGNATPAAQPVLLAPATASAGLATTLSGRQLRELSGYPITAPPPQQNSAQDDYMAVVRDLASLCPPAPDDPALHTPVWKQALGIGLGALAAGLARRPDPSLGAAVYRETAPDRFAQTQQRYALNERSQLAGLTPLLEAAKLERGQSAANTRAWQTQTEDTLRQQQADADADYRALQLQDREQAEGERERQNQALDAARQLAATERAGDQQALNDYRQQVLGLRRRIQASKGTASDASSTQQALHRVLSARSGAQAEQYLANNRTALAARGANLDLLQRAIAQRWGQAAIAPRKP